MTTPAVASQPSASEPDPRIPKLTLLLVLGHQFERLVRDGVVKDYAEIARMTGMTRARVTQIVNLLMLAPDIQEAILELNAEGENPVHERSIRDLVAEPDWRRQRDLWSGLRR